MDARLHKLRPVTRLSLSSRIFIGLAAGLILGLSASATQSPALLSVAIGSEPIGTIWMNMVRMCVIPLVFTALVSGVAAVGDVRRLSRVGARTFGLMFGTILLGGVWGLLLALRWRDNDGHRIPQLHDVIHEHFDIISAGHLEFHLSEHCHVRRMERDILQCEFHFAFAQNRRLIGPDQPDALDKLADSRGPTIE